MIPPQAHEYLSSLRIDPHATRQCCLIPLGGIYWSDEIPDFKALLRVPEDERQSINRLFGIRFRLWANEVLSSEDDIFWCYCKKTYPECPILQRSILSQEDQEAQDACVTETIVGFDALFSGAEKLEVKEGPHGTQSFSATFDLTKEVAPVPLWKRVWRRWTKGRKNPISL
ncbi:MAG: hypothetical protein QM760_09675 [Nibricoccus sp.]